MQDWSSYTLSDLLLFSPRVYERMFVLLNQDLWPLQLLFIAIGLVIVVLIQRRHRLAGSLGCAALGVGWLIVAFVFFQGRYQEINWLGNYLVPLALMQGVGLLALASVPGQYARLADFSSPVSCWAARMPLALGLVAYPLVALAFGRSIESAQVALSAPAPTAVATLGMAALLKSRARWIIIVVPGAWCILTGLTLWTLGRADFFVAPLAAGLALMATALPRRRFA